VVAALAARAALLEASHREWDGRAFVLFRVRAPRTGLRVTLVRLPSLQQTAPDGDATGDRTCGYYARYTLEMMGAAMETLELLRAAASAEPSSAYAPASAPAPAAWQWSSASPRASPLASALASAHASPSPSPPPPPSSSIDVRPPPPPASVGALAPAETAGQPQRQPPLAALAPAETAGQPQRQPPLAALAPAETPGQPLRQQHLGALPRAVALLPPHVRFHQPGWSADAARGVLPLAKRARAADGNVYARLFAEALPERHDALEAAARALRPVLCHRAHFASWFARALTAHARDVRVHESLFELSPRQLSVVWPTTAVLAIGNDGLVGVEEDAALAAVLDDEMPHARRDLRALHACRSAEPPRTLALAIVVDGHWLGAFVHRHAGGVTLAVTDSLRSDEYTRLVGAELVRHLDEPPAAVAPS